MLTAAALSKKAQLLTVPSLTAAKPESRLTKNALRQFNMEHGGNRLRFPQHCITPERLAWEGLSDYPLDTSQRCLSIGADPESIKNAIARALILQPGSATK